MPAAAVQHVSRDELRRILEIQRGAQFVTIVARTDARLKKRHNPIGPAAKVARVNGVICWNYGMTVRRQQLREGRPVTFAPSARAWGSRVQLPPAANPKPKRGPRGIVPLIVHRGRLYLELKVERVLDVRYQDAGGATLTAEQVAPYLPKRKSNAARQGVTREVVLRDYQLDTIESITLGGHTYTVTR